MMQRRSSLSRFLRRILCALLTVCLISGSASAASTVVAGTHFNYSSGLVSTIGMISTTNMTWSKGGYFLMRALQNLEGQIDTVEAKVSTAVTADSLDAVFQKYFAAQSDGSKNMWQNLYNLYNRVVTLNSNMNTRLDALKSTITTTNDRIGSNFSYYEFSGGKILASASDLASVLSGISSLIYDGSFLPSNTFLDSAGHATHTGPMSLPLLTASGFLGLSANLAGSDKSTTFSLLDDDLVSQDKTVSNLLDALGLIGTSLQNPLAKIQYVLADEDDIALKDASKDNQNSFKDNFTGDGDAAVKPSDIGDMAAISGSVKDSFGGAGSAGDAFLVINDSDSYSFFSQEVADSLDTVGAPQARTVADDDWMDAFEADEDGFYSLADTSAFDASAFLGGLLQ